MTGTMGRNTILRNMNFLTVLVAAVLLVIISVYATWAGEVGRVTLDGKQIILHDDNTWEFVAGSNSTASADKADCVEIKSKTLPTSICLDEKVWHLGANGGAAEHNFTTGDDKLFLLMITEDAEIPLDKFEKAITANAQKAAGLNPVDVQIKERIDAFGIKWGRMVYVANIDGLKIKYENFFTTLKDKGSVQYVFYATPEDYADKEPEIEKAIKRIAIR